MRLLGVPKWVWLGELLSSLGELLHTKYDENESTNESGTVTIVKALHKCLHNHTQNTPSILPLTSSHTLFHGLAASAVRSPTQGGLIYSDVCAHCLSQPLLDITLIGLNSIPCTY